MVFAGVALLAITVVTGPIAEAHHPVVTVDGTTIDRTALRARMTLDAEVQAAREAVLRTAVGAGQVTPEDESTLARVIAADADDLLRSAVDGLVRDQLIRDEAREAGLEIVVDERAELERSVVEPLAIRVRVVTLAQPYADPAPPIGDWPSPAPNTATASDIDAATAVAAARSDAALRAGTVVRDVVFGLQQAGWRVTGGDQWLAATGPVAGLPDGIVAALRAATPNAAPTTLSDPITGITAVGIRLADQIDATTATSTIDQARIDGGALHVWAEARAAERALRELFATRWASQPAARSRVAELVVGSADLEGAPGPYRSFGHLVIHQLGEPTRQPSESDDALANRLAGELRALAPADRAERFGQLVAAANATSTSDPLAGSGELGYFTRDQILPAIGDLAFADEVEQGAILGPVATVVGPELFAVRAQFAGVLDDRTNAALVEARTTRDLAAMARRVSPVGEARRADGTLWRADAETVGDPAVHRAYAETPIGARSDPIVVDDEILVVVPLERTVGRFGAGELDRLITRGFEIWLAGRLSAAAVIRDAEPLPGVVVESPAPSGTLSASSAPSADPSPAVAPSSSARPFPIATPKVIP